MNLNDALEILKYTLPALIVLFATYSIVQKFLTTEAQKKQLEMLHDTQSDTTRLRLHAYERLVIFIERIHPRNLIPRLYQPGMTVGELQAVVLMNVKAEFEHNLSQQIYVSKNVWNTVRNVKEQEMNMINQIAQQLGPDAPAKELHTRIVDYVLTVEELPIDVAINAINDEAKLVLSYGSLQQ